MKLFDGRDSLEFARTEASVAVTVTSAQVRMDSIAVIRSHAAAAEEPEDGDGLVLQYRVPVGARTLRRAASESRSRAAALQTAQLLSSLKPLAGRFRVPFLHPENIWLTGGGATVLHFGLVGMLAPMESEGERFLAGYKALVLSVLHPRLSFERLVDGSVALTDPLSQRIVALETVDEVASLIDAELAAETARAARERMSVPKRRYRAISVAGAAAAIAATVLGWFTYTSYGRTLPRQEAIIAAQSHFLTSDYARALGDLTAYRPADLPKSARYVMAVSSVKLTDLTGAQKQAVLNNISTKTDDNTLDYWIHLGRGELERALNLAQNLGDDQLTLLAYTDLYEATKLNTTMDGARKQKLLDEYGKKIEELTARLGAEQ